MRFPGMGAENGHVYMCIVDIKNMKTNVQALLPMDEQGKLFSRKMDNYMFALGMGSIASMLSITLGLFFLS